MSVQGCNRGGGVFPIEMLFESNIHLCYNRHANVQGAKYKVDLSDHHLQNV